MTRDLNLAEIERLLHETMPEPEATRWRYETIVALVARVRELEKDAVSRPPARWSARMMEEGYTL